MKNCIRSSKVCAEVCSSLAQILATSYTNVQGLIDYCKQVCIACADECSNHEHQHCQQCAKACRECAVACDEFSSS
ncbi:four-helix bundle copper-binding protein [Pseudozobellia sp. WGM2]|uniref:four-helix bundle copper-binding protein n=1 Tax=Pseudozobellia sp. WGM2 TaxID=2787625 RepID=UPI00352FDA85